MVLIFYNHHTQISCDYQKIYIELDMTKVNFGIKTKLVDLLSILIEYRSVYTLISHIYLYSNNFNLSMSMKDQIHLVCMIFLIENSNKIM